MWVKRPLDIIFGIAAVVLALPVIVITVFLIYIKLGWPILFVQERVGKNCRVFKIYKFRTMRDIRDRDGELLPDAERLSAFGRFLRSTSLDELPGLFNVIKGDISLVGPRPLLTEYLPLYDNTQIKRHDVLPGVTGWAQVNGRNSITWKEKFELDVWYVKNWSLLLDIKILLMTVFKVFKREGISQAGHATAQRFTGSN